MKIEYPTSTAGLSLVRLAIIALLFQAPAGRAEDPKSTLASPKPTLTASPAGGKELKLLWDANAVGYILQTRPAFSPGTPWAPVIGQGKPIAGAGSVTVPTAPDAVSFYRFAGVKGVGPRVASIFPNERVDVPILEPGDRVAPKELTVLLQPEAAVVQLSNSVTFVAVVTGYSTDPTNLIFRWEYKKDPYTTNVVTTNSTWRDLNIGSNTNYLQVPGSLTNTNVLFISSVTTNEVAYYRVTVTEPGPISASSAAAPLWAYKPTNSVYVYGTPVSMGGGSTLGCPGSFSYVEYFPGSYPDSPVLPSNNYRAFDFEFGNTSVYYTDYTGRYTGWGPCASGSASILPSNINPYVPYYFAAYIPSSDPPPPSPYYLYEQGFH